MKSDRDNVVVGDLVALRMAKHDDEIPQIAWGIVVEELDVTGVANRTLSRYMEGVEDRWDCSDRVSTLKRYH